MELDVTLYARLHGRVENERNLHLFEIPSSRLDLGNVLMWLVDFLCKSKASDIVQIECFSPLRSLILCALLKPLVRTKILVLHDRHWSYDPRRGRLVHKIDCVAQHLAFRLYDRIIVAGEGLKKWYLTLHGTHFSGKILVIPNGSPRIELKDYERQELRSKYGFSPDTFIALFFGSMLFKPNRDTVQRIYGFSERVAKRFKECSERNLLFVVAGKGTEHLKRSEFVIPLGFVDDIFELLFMADACVIPHRPSYSGPHVKTLYSFAAGKPVITTSEGIKDMPSVKEGVHFLSFRPDDPDSLANVLTRLHKDEELAKRISKNAYSYAQSYSWQDIAKRYYSVYIGAAPSKNNWH